MTYELLLMDKFEWNEISGKLYFSRYFDNNPALVIKSNDEIPIATCTVNIPEFFREYPFGDNKLIAVKNFEENQGILEALQDAYVVEPVFTIKDSFDTGEINICELTDPVVDLLKTFGEYYV